MKKVVYYARVSTSLQEEKGTIESQKTELINQIKSDGNILVREYIDNGWSGGRLDRPALDELRNDIKTDEFDAVYFLDADRIARNVTYQNIIISELLKYDKEIIIRGKNYIDNPENKFNLTILGAVSELEKAKIAERFMRGRREKARRGAIVDSGGLFGHTHIKRTDKSDGRYEINEEQAEVVRFIYNTYNSTNSSLNSITRQLEEKGIKTATGKDYWKAGVVKRILSNTSYYGEHYFNQSTRIESKNKKERYSKHIKTVVKMRDESEWIMVPIPPIIDKGLFDRVQEKLKRNKKILRSTDNKYSLGGLIKCGDCNHTYSGVHWKGVKYYKCNYRDKGYNHKEETELKKCFNKAINGEDIEKLIDETIKENILKPSIIKRHIDILKSKKTDKVKQLKERTEKINVKISNLESQKKRILDLYAEGELERDQYIYKIEELDKKNKEVLKEKDDILNRIKLIDSKKEVKTSIKEFCKYAKKKYEKLDNDLKGEFIRNIIDEITIFKNSTQNKLVINGIIPLISANNVNLPMYCNSDSSGCYNAEVIRFKIIIDV